MRVRAEVEGAAEWRMAAAAMDVQVVMDMVFLLTKEVRWGANDLDWDFLFSKPRAGRLAGHGVATEAEAVHLRVEGGFVVATSCSSSSCRRPHPMAMPSPAELRRADADRQCHPRPPPHGLVHRRGPEPGRARLG